MNIHVNDFRLVSESGKLSIDLSGQLGNDERTLQLTVSVNEPSWQRKDVDVQKINLLDI